MCFTLTARQLTKFWKRPFFSTRVRVFQRFESMYRLKESLMMQLKLLYSIKRIRSDLYRLHPAYLSVIRDIQNELSSHSSALSFCPSVVSLLADSLSLRHPPLFSHVTFSWGAQNPTLPWAQLVLTCKCSLNPVLKGTTLLQGQSVTALLSVNCRCF